MRSKDNAQCIIMGGFATMTILQNFSTWKWQDGFNA